MRICFRVRVSSLSAWLLAAMAPAHKQYALQSMAGLLMTTAEALCMRFCSSSQFCQRWSSPKHNSSDAECLLDELELTQVLGNDSEPIVVPSNGADIPAFDYSVYPNKNAGLADLLQYHQLQLEQYGASFGQDGFRIYDIHAQQGLWSIRSSKNQLSGIADLCVASHGLYLNSAAKRAFVVYVHKQTAAQKEAYRNAHTITVQVRPRG